MSRAQYQRIESGHVLASAEQARALETILGVPVPSEEQLIRNKERRVISRAALLRIEDRSRATWVQAARKWGLHGLDQSTWAQLCFFFETGSSRECGGLAQVAAGGARVCRIARCCEDSTGTLRWTRTTDSWARLSCRVWFMIRRK